MKDNFINIDLFCDYHIAKYIEYHNKEEIFLNAKKNPISSIIRVFIGNSKKNYKYYYNVSLENKTKVNLKISTRFFFQYGCTISDDDHIKINSTLNVLFKQQLFSFVLAAKFFSKQKLNDSICKFLNIYNINEDEYDGFFNLVESLRRDLYRKGINN